MQKSPRGTAILLCGQAFKCRGVVHVCLLLGMAGQGCMSLLPSGPANWVWQTQLQYQTQYHQSTDCQQGRLGYGITLFIRKKTCSGVQGAVFVPLGIISWHGLHLSFQAS
jgi:hypothetical protein